MKIGTNSMIIMISQNKQCLGSSQQQPKQLHAQQAYKMCMCVWQAKNPANTIW